MLIAMAALLLLLLVYALKCVRTPFAPCRKCKGAGETSSWLGARTCRRCRGHKLRLRVGRRAHNAWRRTYQDGTRS